MPGTFTCSLSMSERPQADNLSTSLPDCVPQNIVASASFSPGTPTPHSFASPRREKLYDPCQIAKVIIGGLYEQYIWKQSVIRLTLCPPGCDSTPMTIRDG